MDNDVLFEHCLGQVGHAVLSVEELEPVEAAAGEEVRQAGGEAGRPVQQPQPDRQPHPSRGHVQQHHQRVRLQIPCYLFRYICHQG